MAEQDASVSKLYLLQTMIDQLKSIPSLKFKIIVYYVYQLLASHLKRQLNKRTSNISQVKIKGKLLPE